MQDLLAVEIRPHDIQVYIYFLWLINNLLFVSKIHACGNMKKQRTFKNKGNVTMSSLIRGFLKCLRDFNLVNHMSLVMNGVFKEFFHNS